MKGIIRNKGYGGCKGAVMETLRLEDMRAREEFNPGCQVCCPGVQACQSGAVMWIDADGRMAMVDWGCEMVGWWYLKDLKVIGFNITQRRQEHKEILIKEKYAEMAEP